MSAFSKRVWSAKSTPRAGFRQSTIAVSSRSWLVAPQCTKDAAEGSKARTCAVRACTKAIEGVAGGVEAVAVRGACNDLRRGRRNHTQSGFDGRQRHLEVEHGAQDRRIGKDLVEGFRCHKAIDEFGPHADWASTLQQTKGRALVHVRRAPSERTQKSAL